MEGFGQFGEVLGLLLTQLLELLGQALLVLELLLFGPGGVGLGRPCVNSIPTPCSETAPLTCVFFCSESTKPLENRTGVSLRPTIISMGVAPKEPVLEGGRTKRRRAARHRWRVSSSRRPL
jgi:hypothetical protein